LWLLLSGAYRELKHHPTLYQELVDKKCQSIEAIHQIDADLTRTSLENEAFDVESLRRILGAYSNHNENLGYCQGMHWIVKRMMHVLLDEEHTFWLLDQLIQLLPKGYYTTMVCVPL
jgi:hypothetical protein